jgi:hypothetical protein
MLRARLLLVALLTCVAPTMLLEAQSGAPVIGRWDLTVQGRERPYPSWLEVTQSGNRTLVGRFVAGGGSARPIARVTFADNTLRFSIPPQWERSDNDLVVSATLANEQLRGTLVTPNGESQAFVGVRAPVLRRSAAPVWDAPMALLANDRMDQWEPLPGTSRWSMVGKVLTNSQSGANLRTKALFEDFRLALDVRVPKDGNSGIYLRGRHEVQVEDSPIGEPRAIDMGAIYGFLVPNEAAQRAAGEWQHFDITLIGRRVTVVLNGRTIINDQTIPGITGGALDSDEGAPGPIYLQGDHTAVEYRNIVITPAKRAK